ncbi:hypothetical protein [Flavobacterium sp.]|uniref:hypothetical protein n=1 Tax=Flavobacterium sp. TaxID=239 RepID=UPI0031DDACDA
MNALALMGAASFLFCRGGTKRYSEQQVSALEKYTALLHPFIYADLMLEKSLI